MAAGRLIFFVFVTLIVTSITSCLKPPCQCDPPGPIPYLEFRIVNQQGQNLVFGSSAIFKVDTIQLLKNYNDFSVSNASVNRSYIDSTNLAFNFHVPEAKSFIYYGRQAKTDTLEIDWVHKEGKCCGEPFPYYSPETFKLNDQSLQPRNGVYYIVK
jgi:hypothetical protein